MKIKYINRLVYLLEKEVGYCPGQRSLFFELLNIKTKLFGGLIQNGGVTAAGM